MPRVKLTGVVREVKAAQKALRGHKKGRTAEEKSAIDASIARLDDLLTTVHATCDKTQDMYPGAPSATVRKGR